MKEKIIGYDVIDFLTKSIALRFKLNGKDFTHVIGIARGGMIPATIDQMKAIADDGLKMPPKSTYIEPKLRSGVTIYEF